MPRGPSRAPAPAPGPQAYVNGFNMAMEKYLDAQAKGDVSAMIALQPAIKVRGGPAATGRGARAPPPPQEPPEAAGAPARPAPAPRPPRSSTAAGT